MVSERLLEDMKAEHEELLEATGLEVSSSTDRSEWPTYRLCV